MTSRILIFIFLLFGAIDGVGQRYLVVENFNNPRKRVKYEAGDQLMLRLDGEKTRLRGTIEMIGDSSFFFNDAFIKPSRIDVVYDFESRAALRGTAYGAFIAIPVMMGLNAMDNWINKGQGFTVDDGVLRISAVFAGIGLVMIPLSIRKFRMNSKWGVRLLDTTFYR